MKGRLNCSSEFASAATGFPKASRAETKGIRSRPEAYVSPTAAAAPPAPPRPAPGVPPRDACAEPVPASSVRAAVACTVAACAAVACAGAPASARAGELVRIITLEDEVIAGTSISVAKDGRVALKRTGGGGFECRMDEIRLIVNANPAATSSQTAASGEAVAEIFPRGGGRILARNARTDGAFLLAEIPEFGEGARRIPLAAVAAIRFSPGEATAIQGTSAVSERFKAALKDPDRARDRIFLVKDGKSLDAAGALVALGEKTLSFKLDDETLEVPRNRVGGVVLAAAGGTAEAMGGVEGRAPAGTGPDRTGIAAGEGAEARCVAKLTEGSEICGYLLSIQGGKLEMRTHFEGSVPIPWERLLFIKVQSDRTVYLSDIEPVAVVERPAFNVKWGYRRDAGVVGGPISIRKNVYEKGLGVHSRCDLTYELGGRFRLLLAAIGIDDSAGGRGDCIFRVLGDGNVLLERRARGTDAPIPISVKIEGVNRLTLSVDFGEDLDIGDHADWADCRAVK